MMEQALRQALMMSRGDFWIFLSRPIATVMLAAAMLLLVWHAFGLLRHARARRSVPRHAGVPVEGPASV
jgi:TctA family transporter